MNTIAFSKIKDALAVLKNDNKDVKKETSRKT